jgi:hypothetical protein
MKAPNKLYVDTETRLSDSGFAQKRKENGIEYVRKDAFIDTLEVKEVKESKLLNPRFPHLNNIIDKVFGTANLESWEYEEAKQLVLLAREELLRDLEVKEADLEKVFDDEYSKFSNDVDAMDYSFPIDLADYRDFAKHFFELGLKTSQKGE